MIDIKFLRDNPDVVRASQKGRGENVEIVDQIIAADERKRAALLNLKPYAKSRMFSLNQWEPLKAMKRQRYWLTLKSLLTR